MFDFDLGWILTFIGGSTMLTVAALAIFAPSVLRVASEWLVALSPLLKGVAEGLVNLAKSLWEGFLDITDNGKTILTVGLAGAACFLWGYSYAPTKVETRVEYRERCSSGNRVGTPPRPTKRPPPDPFTSWLDDIFGVQ